MVCNAVYGQTSVIYSMYGVGLALRVGASLSVHGIEPDVNRGPYTCSATWLSYRVLVYTVNTSMRIRKIDRGISVHDVGKERETTLHLENWVHIPKVVVWCLTVLLVEGRTMRRRICLQNSR